MPESREHATLLVEGMDCNNCALSITKKLQKNPELQDVSVNFATGEARFTPNTEEAVSQASAAIESLGYKVISKPEPGEVPKAFSAAEKKFIFSFVFTLPLFILHMFFPPDFILNRPFIQLGLCLPVFVLGLLQFGRSAVKSILAGFPNMDVLIALGSTSAFIYSVIAMGMYSGHRLHEHLYFETAATILCIILLGNVIEKRSVRLTTDAIRELTALQPLKVRKVKNSKDGEELIEINFSEVIPGDILAMNTGDRVPTDGELTFGSASVDESMITGESLPVEKAKGDKLVGGTIVVNGQLRMRAEQIGDSTVLSKIIHMVKHAQESKPELQKLGDRVSAVFVPAVIIIAAATFFIRHYLFGAVFSEALMNSVAVLVISCPCAMGLATPTAVMVGIGRAARKGILIKGGSTIEAFAGIKRVIFDKTGTLSTGKFKIGAIKLFHDTTEEEARLVLYHLELYSSHPIARSLVQELKPSPESARLTFITTSEEKGLGLRAEDRDGNRFAAGSYEMVRQLTEESGYQVYLIKNDILMAAFTLEDEIKPGVNESVAFFKKNGIESILLSGDMEGKCRQVAEKNGISRYFSQASPSHKLEIIQNLVKESPVAMFGDGINDAPALASATVGISVGSATQAAIQQAQIVLLNSKDLNQLKEAWLISKHTLITIRQNLFWAFFYNVLAIPLAASGMLSPMIAAFSMAFSDLVVVGNSVRLRSKSLT